MSSFGEQLSAVGQGDPGSAISARLGGKGAAAAAGHSVTRSRGDLHGARHPLVRFRVQVHSRPITKNILVVWRNWHSLTPSRSHSPGARSTRPALARPWPPCARKVRVFELGARTAAGGGARGAGAPPMAGRARVRAPAIGPPATRQWPRRPEFEARRGSLWNIDWKASYCSRGDFPSAGLRTPPKRLYRTERRSFCRLSLLRGASRWYEQKCARPGSVRRSSSRKTHATRALLFSATSDLHPSRRADHAFRFMHSCPIFLYIVHWTNV